MYGIIWVYNGLFEYLYGIILKPKELTKKYSIKVYWLSLDIKSLLPSARMIIPPTNDVHCSLDPNKKLMNIEGYANL